MAVEHDLRVTHGESLVRVFTWTTADGARQSLDGWTPRGQVRPYTSPGFLLLDLGPYLSVVRDVRDAAGVAGDAIRLDIPAADTRRLTVLGEWALQLVDSEGGEAVRGVVLVSGLVRVTRSAMGAASV